jgi:hypothetical protein
MLRPRQGGTHQHEERDTDHHGVVPCRVGLGAPQAVARMSDFAATGFNPFNSNSEFNKTSLSILNKPQLTIKS